VHLGLGVADAAFVAPPAPQTVGATGTLRRSAYVAQDMSPGQKDGAARHAHCGCARHCPRTWTNGPCGTGTGRPHWTSWAASPHTPARYTGPRHNAADQLMQHAGNLPRQCDDGGHGGHCE